MKDHPSIWFHVDAAWAGVAFACPEFRAMGGLDAINKYKAKNPGQCPWALTFSYGRALQGEAMQAWANGDNKDSQKKWVDRATWSGQAAEGKYEGGCP